ncbi:hypothetical protein NQS36_13265 [Bacillus sp. C1(2022)]|uniref:BclA C-terminal domain-containing protein n=1 Tax=Bacillus TaxID=1386 RepID=UPI000B1D9C9C|nr:hypothetical protein [Bacillus licheniformis]MED1634324.1 hypothetical protein [Bacillus licheniformis]WCO61355.1 hypothetical protein OSR41_13960 [Bacillus licheniformis]
MYRENRCPYCGRCINVCCCVKTIGIPGKRGRRGQAGPQGPTGPTGATGATGTSVTENSMYASNTIGSTILVVLGGSPIPLPNNQSLDGFIANGSNTTFTVPVTGRYYLSYQINTTASLLAGSRLTLNGSPISGSIISPAVAISSYNNDVIANLQAGDNISLQLFGLVATVILLGGESTGAALSVIRLN